LNALQLSGSFYLLHLYDRVLPAQSLVTLVSLTILVLALHAAYAALDLFRSSVLGRTGFALVKALERRAFRALGGGAPGVGRDVLSEVDRVRVFLTGAGPAAFLDVVWLPFYLAAAFLLHPLLGLFAGCGALLLAGLTALAEVVARGPQRALAGVWRSRLALADGAQRGAETHRAMGIGGRLAARWDALADTAAALGLAHQERLAVVGAIAKGIRLSLQSCGIGLGAYLLIGGEVSAGAMIAASLFMVRAFSLVDQVLVHWRGLAGARQAYMRLASMLTLRGPIEMPRVGLPGSRTRLAVDGLVVVPPGGSHAVVRDVSFAIDGGSALAIVGPSGAGKSSLTCAIAGAWPLTGAGSVRLDGPGASARWDGAHIGFLPHRFDLVPATVGETIARLDPDASHDAIAGAAHAAGVHDLILRLADGYDTQLGGDTGVRLSAGELQRIALARALYGDPPLVVLDEPSMHLDAAGEAALIEAILSVRRRGGLVVIATHRSSLLATADQLLVLAQGRMQAFGSKEAVLRHGLAAPAPGAAGRAAGGRR
jgi:ATP-binding cassette subfamily C protein